MIRTTPFHPRLEELNRTGLWSHWAGYLTAEKYDMSAKHEYFAVRNSAGFFDTSPLYKYAIRGRDAERFLAGVLARDIRTCRPGSAQYTLWCDDRGFVIEDGVVLRHSDDEFVLTAAEPNYAYFSDLIGSLEVVIEDVSERFGALAVQGPRSRAVLTTLAPDVEQLGFFELCQTKISGVPVTVSRTGYTGDLGYEIWVDADDALPMLDAVLEAGGGHGMRPFGQQALLMTRIEAGLILLDVDFHSSRFAFTDHDRSTPMELGFGWMFRKLAEQDRPFIGRRAIADALANKTARWRTVGLEIDWRDYERVYTGAGLIPPKSETPVEHETMLYDDDGNQAGYATSLMYSPVLQRHIGIARVTPDLAGVGTRVHVELTINHRYHTAVAWVARPPLFNPQRKTA